jgi:hypothetical protein
MGVNITRQFSLDKALAFATNISSLYNPSAKYFAATRLGATGCR